MLLTEWEEFRKVDWSRLANRSSRDPLIIDGRNDSSAPRGSSCQRVSLYRNWWSLGHAEGGAVHFESYRVVSSWRAYRIRADMLGETTVTVSKKLLVRQ